MSDFYVAIKSDSIYEFQINEKSEDAVELSSNRKIVTQIKSKKGGEI